MYRFAKKHWYLISAALLFCVIIISIQLQLVLKAFGCPIKNCTTGFSCPLIHSNCGLWQAVSVFLIYTSITLLITLTGLKIKKKWRRRILFGLIGIDLLIYFQLKFVKATFFGMYSWCHKSYECDPGQMCNPLTCVSQAELLKAILDVIFVVSIPVIFFFALIEIVFWLKNKVRKY